MTRSTCTRVIFFALSLPSSLFSPFYLLVHTRSLHRRSSRRHIAKKKKNARIPARAGYFNGRSRAQNKPVLRPLFPCQLHPPAFPAVTSNETSNVHPQGTICLTRSCETRRGSKLHALFERQHTLRADSSFYRSSCIRVFCARFSFSRRSFSRLAARGIGGIGFIESNCRRKEEASRSKQNLQK